MPSTSIRCRQIVDADIESIIDLLTLGLRAERDRAFWVRALDRLGRHAPPPGYPHFGYVLDNAGIFVGVLLQIFTRTKRGAPVYRNMSSWWLMPEFRVYGSIMVSCALRHDAIYTDVLRRRTLGASFKARGYVPYSKGRVMALPWLSRDAVKARVAPFSEGMTPDEHLTAWDIAMLSDHAAYGCICMTCEADGRCYPFVFAPRWRYGVIGIALPIYCSEGGEVQRFAGALGRYLARRGHLLMYLDANGPLRGLHGIYNPRRPKFYRGANPPRVGDYSYSEWAMFGS